LVSQQDGFGHHGTEPARSTKSDNDDDRMQKKGENVAHAEDGIRLRKLKNSGRLRNSPPTPRMRAKWKGFARKMNASGSHEPCDGNRVPRDLIDRDSLKWSQSGLAASRRAYGAIEKNCWHRSLFGDL